MATIVKRKTDSGEPRWTVRYDIYANGERKQVFKAPKAANDFHAKTKNAILTGRYSDAKGLTVGEYLETWLEIYTRNLRPNSLRGYQNAVYKHTIPRCGGEYLESLNTATIQKCLMLFCELSNAQPSMKCTAICK